MCTELRFVTFAVGVFAVVTSDRRLPKAAFRRRRKNVAFPYRFVLLVLARPTIRAARCERSRPRH
jgi:hypothetical protein